jgi:Putative Actinobacterial Holin-X, holin superfamily III
MAAQRHADPQVAAKAERPLSELVTQMTSDVGTLVRKEIELAKIEIKEDVQRTAKAGGMLGAAGFAGYMAVVLLSFAIAFLLAEVIPTWLGFLIVAVIWAAVGFVLFQQGRARMKQGTLVPEQTVETVKEDVEWVKARRK